MSIVNQLKRLKKRGKGYDGVKKIKGRKKHIIVDTQGFLLVPYVSTADMNDRTALEKMIEILQYKTPFLKKLWADMGYQRKSLKTRLLEKGIEIVEGFKVLLRRWVIERTFAWISYYRRMSKDKVKLPVVLIFLVL